MHVVFRKGPGAEPCIHSVIFNVVKGGRFHCIVSKGGSKKEVRKHSHSRATFIKATEKASNSIQKIRLEGNAAF